MAYPIRQLRSLLLAVHAIAEAVQRELFEGLPEHDQVAHARRVRQALESPAIDHARRVLNDIGPTSDPRCVRLVEALTAECDTLDQARAIAQAAHSSEDLINGLWDLGDPPGTDWDPGWPLRRARAALEHRLH